MPNINELLAKLPKGSASSKKKVDLEMELEAAKKRAAYTAEPISTKIGRDALEQSRKTLKPAKQEAVIPSQTQPSNAWLELIGGQGKTRAGTPASPTPLDEQLGRTTARIKGFINEPEEELKRTVYQYLPAPGDSPEEQERKLNDLAMGFAGTTTGKVPRMSKAQAIESGLYHPVGAGKKLARPVSEVEFTRVPDPNMPMAPRKLITPEDLYKKQGYPVPWDASAAGELLTGMGGKAFEEPVVLQGGVGYQRTHGGAHSPQKLAVASQPGIISRHSNIIQRIASEGDDPVSVVLAMSPGHGLDYNKMLANTLVQELKNAKIPSKLAKEFDEEVRKAHPNFVGVKSKKLADQLNEDTSGELRKTFAKRMTLEQFQKGGFPDVIEARVAISTPEMLNAPVGTGGMSFGLMDPAGGVVKEAVKPHHTYKAASPGEYMGSMDVGFSTEELFPQFFEQRRLLSADPKDDWYAFGRTIPTQRFDQEWLDKVMPLYEQRMKELIGKKAGGLAEGGVPEKRDVSQLFPLKVPADNAELKPEPKYPLLEKAAQGVQAAHEFVSAPFGYENPAGEMVSSFLGVPAVAKTMENIAYGTPLTTGSGMTTNLRPETAEAAMAVAPLVGPAVKTGTKVGKALAPTAAEMALDLAEKGGAPVRQFVVPPSEVKAGKAKVPANKLGFYNPAEKAALNLQRKKGTGDTFIADLKKQPGVNDERIAELGLDQFKGKPDVTNADIYATARENRIPLEESVRRERDEDLIATLENRNDEILRRMDEAEQAGDRRAYAEYNDEWQQNILEQKRLKGSGEAKFGPSEYPDYSMPGGTDYREIRIKLPSNRPSLKNMSREEYNAAIEKADAEGVKDFEHSGHHGDEPNVLLHIRGANHVDAEGKKGFLIDELQSDWHQQGREKGYVGNLPERAKVIYAKDTNKYFVGKDGEVLGWGNTKEEAINNASKHYGSVPDAPFKDNWYQLGLKRAIKEAADTGMDRVYLTTGSRQADRYDLSKQIGSLSIKPKPNNMVSINAYKDGEVVIMKEVPKDQLADYIGKDMAKKAIGDIDAGKNALYSDLDLKVGGEGMKQWYDNTYKNYLEKYAKQFGSKLGETKIQTELASNEWPNFRDWFEAKYPDLVSRSLVFWEAGPSNRYVKEFEKTLGKKYEPVYYIDITDAMRESAKKGQSYAEGGAVRMAEGGAVNSWQQLIQSSYNTNPDMKDGGAFIQAPAFAKGGAVSNAWINLIEGAQNA